MVEQRGAANGHALVPSVQQSAAHAVAQQTVPLLHRARVGGEHLAIARVCLGAKRIKLRAAPRGGALHKRKIVRAEQHGEQRAGQVACLARLAVAQKAPLLGRHAQLHVYDAAVSLEPCRHARLGGTGGQQLGRRGLAERLAGREILERLHRVGLANGVGPHEHRHTLVERKLSLAQVAVAAEADVSDGKRHGGYILTGMSR